ncbi:hypothetical protein AGMMS50212_07120 [Spirochaetia bacterium]|nr:hypothetical protein AGMMS50212_06990 [Spirochaetia bacterium]GHV83372.1 hypothetical protein AGMMS50212_07120 [Spirochaetia bacterium]
MEEILDRVRMFDNTQLLQVELLARTLRLDKLRSREKTPIAKKQSITDSLAGSLAGFTGSLEDIRSERLGLL